MSNFALRVRKAVVTEDSNRLIIGNFSVYGSDSPNIARGQTICHRPFVEQLGSVQEDAGD